MVSVRGEGGAGGGRVPRAAAAPPPVSSRVCGPQGLDRPRASRPVAAPRARGDHGRVLRASGGSVSGIPAREELRPLGSHPFRLL